MTIEFGRGKDKKKRKPRKDRGRGGIAVAAGSLAGASAIAGAGVMWAKKRKGAGVSGVPGFNNTTKMLTGNPVGDSQQLAAGIMNSAASNVRKATSTVTSADTFAKSYLAQTGRSMNNTGEAITSSFDGSIDTLVTKAGKAGKKAGKAYKEVARGINQGLNEPTSPKILEASRRAARATRKTVNAVKNKAASDTRRTKSFFMGK